MRRRADVDAMTVPGLHAALRSDGSGGPVDTTAVELTLAGVELSPLVEWTVLRAFERLDRLRVHRTTRLR